MGGRSVLVIGGGIAGLSAGYALKRNGFDVRLLEASDRLGGRVGEDQVRAMRFNAGARLVYPFSKPFNALLDELGLTPSLQSIGHLVARCQGENGAWDIELMPGFRSLLTPGLTSRERLRFLRLGAQLLRKKHTTDPDDAASVGAVDRQTLQDFIERTLGPNVLERMVEPVFRSTRSWNSDCVSPSFFLSTTPHLINGRSPAVFRGGMSILPETLGRIVPHETGVRVVAIEQGAPCRVHAMRDGANITYEAELVVCAVEGDRINTLVPGLPDADRAFFSGVRYNPWATVHYQVATDLAEDIRFFTRGANPVLSIYQQHPADPAKDHPAQIYAQLTPEATATARKEGLTERLHTITDEAVRALYPALDRDCVDHHGQWIERMLPLFYPGYGHLVRAFRERRAQSRQSLYFCGDYLSQALLTGAGTSGLRVAEQINRDWT